MTKINSRNTTLPACEDVGKHVYSSLETLMVHLDAVKAKVDKRLSA